MQSCLGFSVDFAFLEAIGLTPPIALAVRFLAHLGTMSCFELLADLYRM